MILLLCKEEMIFTSSNMYFNQCVGEVQKAAAVGGSLKGSSLGSIELLAAQLASASPNEQKQLLAERLYPLIQGYFPGEHSPILLSIFN